MLPEKEEYGYDYNHFSFLHVTTLSCSLEIPCLLLLFLARGVLCFFHSLARFGLPFVL